MPALGEIERANVVWTPPPCEVWPAVAGKSGRRVFPVVANQRTILFALKETDANLAAAAPRLYATVVDLLKFFELNDGDSVAFFLVEGGGSARVPRARRQSFPAALRVLAEARGRSWW